MRAAGDAVRAREDVLEKRGWHQGHCSQKDHSETVVHMFAERKDFLFLTFSTIHL